MDDKYLIIGTAGHVDHGKSQLIKALTGISTDRLKEEKERGMSIELGFAYLTLPDGRKAGIIDVPGHEKFIRQMLAGASGMDVVLLVIAADEGVMPQTVEHLSILNLLGITNGIVVLTKIDLVDEEWLRMIEEDIREKLAETSFAEVPICRVSSVSGEGIPGLLQEITKIVDKAESRNVNALFRMPVDRAFSIQGFGTVVTGTLKSGTVQKGQEIYLEPGKVQTKIRNIQVHNEQVDKAYAGQRAAINISGLAVDEVAKGSVLVENDEFPVGQILDITLTNLFSNQKPLEHRQRVHFYLGTAQIIGTIHLLDREQLLPGDECLAQILLEESVVAVKGDRFVLRFFSPVTTIGGGTVISIASNKRKRFKETNLNELKLRAQGKPAELLTANLLYPLNETEIVKKLGIEKEIIMNELKRMIDENQIIVLSEEGQNIYWNANEAAKFKNRITNLISEHQKKYPLRNGIGREELKNKLLFKSTTRRWQTILEWLAKNREVILGEGVVQSTQPVQLPPAINKNIQCLVNLWQKADLNPPSLAEGSKTCQINEKEILEYASYLCSKQSWQKIGDYYFNSNSVRQAQEKLVAYLKKHNRITAADARDLWKTSRKYALPLLEYFDSVYLTKREDNYRYLFDSNH